MLHQTLTIPRPPIPRSARSSTSSSSTVHSSPASTTVIKPSSSVIKLQFINTAHPSESTSAKRISQIRSHVAKDSHARRRQRKASCKTGKACCPSSASATATSAVAAESPARSESPDDSTSTKKAVALPVRARLPQSSFLDEKEGALFRGFRRIAPKTGAALDRNAEVPCPRQMIGDARRDVWNGAFAWDLTDDEYATFNFCKCKHQSLTPITQHHSIPLLHVHVPCPITLDPDLPVEHVPIATYLLHYHVLLHDGCIHVTAPRYCGLLPFYFHKLLKQVQTCADLVYNHQDLDWVLKYGYEICFPRDQVAPVMKRMKSSYVPFAIKYPSLLACIFYIAYHRRALNTKDPEEAAKCYFMVERYRLACIESMKRAIEGEERPTYQTITLAMQLCSEAVSRHPSRITPLSAELENLRSNC